MLDLIPIELSRAILQEWLFCGDAVPLGDMLTMSALDCAYCSSAQRSVWLEVLRSVVLNKTRLLYSPSQALRWAHARGLRIEAIEIDLVFTTFFHNLQKPFALPSVRSVTFTDHIEVVQAKGLHTFLDLFPQLTELDCFSCTSMTDIIFLQLLHVKSALRVVLLPSASFVSSELQRRLLIQFAPTLERIHCSRIDDEDIFAIAQAVHGLKTLGMFVNHLRGRSALTALLRANSALEYIYLDQDAVLDASPYCPVDDALVEVLAESCPQAQFVFLPSGPVSYRCLPRLLRGCPLLKRVFCGDVELDIALAPDGQRAQCMVTFGEAVTLPAVREILAFLHMPVSSVHLGRNLGTVSVDEGLLHELVERSQGQLEIVNINLDGGVDGAALKFFVSSCPRLTHLYLTVTRADAPDGDLRMYDGMLGLSESCPKLKEIAINGDQLLIDVVVVAVLKGCVGCALNDISLSGCTQLTKEAMHVALDLFPHLASLDMSDTAVRRKHVHQLPRGTRSKVHVG